MEDIRNQVNLTMSQGFEIPLKDLRPEATLFEDLALDSLDAIDLIVYLEEKFALKVDAEMFKDVRTMGDVYVLVEKLSQSDQLKN